MIVVHILSYDLRTNVKKVKISYGLNKYKLYWFFLNKGRKCFLTNDRTLAQCFSSK